MAAHQEPPSWVGCHFLLQCVKVKSLSHVRLFTTPWTAAYQALPSMGFSKQEYWSRVPLPSPAFLSIPDIKRPLVRAMDWQHQVQPTLMLPQGFPGNSDGKQSPCRVRGCVQIPWRRAWQHTSVSLTGASHGQRSLAGYSPWGHKESDTTDWLSTHKHNAPSSLPVSQCQWFRSEVTWAGVFPSSSLPGGCHYCLHSTDEKTKPRRFTTTHSENLSQPVFTLGCSEWPIIFVSTE